MLEIRAHVIHSPHDMNQRRNFILNFDLIDREN